MTRASGLTIRLVCATCGRSIPFLLPRPEWRRRLDLAHEADEFGDVVHRVVWRHDRLPVVVHGVPVVVDE